MILGQLRMGARQAKNAPMNKLRQHFLIFEQWDVSFSNADQGPISDVQSLVTKPHIEGDPSSFLDVFDLTQK